MAGAKAKKQADEPQKASAIAATQNWFRARLSEDRIELTGGGFITLKAVDSQVYCFCADMAVDTAGMRQHSRMWLYMLSFSIVNWKGIKDSAGKEVKPKFNDVFIGGEKYRQLDMELLKMMNPAAVEVLIGRVSALNFLNQDEKKS